MDLTTCPECALPAEITERIVMDSTDGPVEHVRMRCVDRHHFLLPTAYVASAVARRSDAPAASHTA